MAARKTIKAPSADLARSIATLTGEVRGHTRAITERFDALEQRVTDGFALMDERMGRVEDRLGHVEENVADLTLEVGRLKTVVLEHGQQLRHVVRRQEVEGIVEGVLARQRR